MVGVLTGLRDGGRRKSAVVGRTKAEGGHTKGNCEKPKDILVRRGNKCSRRKVRKRGPKRTQTKLWSTIPPWWRRIDSLPSKILTLSPHIKLQPKFSKELEGRNNNQFGCYHHS